VVSEIQSKYSKGGLFWTYRYKQTHEHERRRGGEEERRRKSGVSTLVM
jgi:hypothetical protein